MKKIIIALGALGLASFASADLVTNGGFETNAFGGTNYETVHAGGSDLTNWSVLGNSIDIVGTNYSPYDGHFAVDLAGTPGPGGIAQGLGTTAGSYVVSFWAVSSTPSGVNNILQSGLIPTVSGSSLQTVGHTFNIGTIWAQYSYTESVAGGSSLVLQTSAANNTNGNLFIDDVSVTHAAPVPEPCTVLALGGGLIGLLRKRRAK